MRNNQRNKIFLDGLTGTLKHRILDSVAKHYGVTVERIEDELLDVDAELAFEYITDEELRLFAYSKMQKITLDAYGFPQMLCRYCGAKNPWVYFAPRQVMDVVEVVCNDCAEKKQWLDKDGMLRKDVRL